MMTSSWLREGRLEKGWTQAQAAKRLGVSQTYLSLLESGRRPLSRPLARKAQREFDVPATALPVASRSLVKTVPLDELAGALAALGYPGFTHLKRGRRMNPAELLLAALSASDLEPRLAEALPWVVWKHSDLNWDWLLAQARLRDLQNRVGFVVALAKAVADRHHDADALKALDHVEAALEPSRLAREDTLARASMTQAERRWLRTNRPPLAAHWNLLTALTPDHLSYAS
jgi:transcriptional regulator with XRE-family HTH domain